MQQATYASVEHVAWERSIRWDAPADEESGGAPPAIGGDARVESGAWVGAVRWDGEGAAAREPPIAAAAEDRSRAYREPAGSRTRRRAQGAHKLPKAANARPAQLHRFISADTSDRSQRLFHRPRMGRDLLKAPWRLASAARAGGHGRQLRAASLDQVRAEDLRAADGSLFVGELSEERPGLVANPGMSFALCRLRRGFEKNDSEEEDDRAGVTVDLSTEPSPLLGDLPEPGNELLACVSGLVRQPAFPHACDSFLLCLRPQARRRKGDGPEIVEKEWTCRSLKNHVVACLGQGEPRLEVPPCGSKRYAALQEPLCAFHISRTLLAKSSAAKGDVKNATFPASDLGRALFACAPAPLALVKRAAAEVADRARDAYGEPAKSTEGEDLWTHRAQAVRPDDVALRFAPEDVCAYESASASFKRLQRLGLRKPQLLGGPAGVAPACRKLFEVKRAADARAKDLDARAAGVAGPLSLRDLARAARQRCIHVEATLRAAMRVHEELSLAPAHLTSGFVDAHLQPKQHAVLRLEGPGDPSGCGNAFSFARSTLRELCRGDVIHKQSSQSAKEAYEEHVNTIARRQRHVLSGDGLDDDVVEDDALRDLRGGFVGRGARGPYANSSAYDAARAQKLRDQLKGRRGGASGRRSPGPDDNDDLEDLEADLEQDLLQDEAKDEDERQLDAFRRALQQETNVQEQSGPPKFLVRRITRRLVHGREVVSVGFVNLSLEVERVARRTQVSLAQNADDLFLGDLDDLNDAARPAPKKLTLRLPPEAQRPRKTGAVKLNLTKLRGRADDYRAEAKRQKAEAQRAEALAYHRPVAKREGPRADAQNKPHVQLAKFLREECLNPLYARPLCRPFVRPVNTKQFPLYKAKISRPMDLSTIKSRLERYTYRDREGFMSDIDLIAANSIAFSGPEHPISKEALAMARAARAACDSFDDELGALERATKSMMAAAPKRRRASPAPAAPASAPAGPPPPRITFAGIGRAPLFGNTPPTSPPPQLAQPGIQRQAPTAAAAPLLRVAAARPLSTSPPPSTPFLAAALAEDSSSGEDEAVGGGAVPVPSPPPMPPPDGVPPLGGGTGYIN